MLKLKKGISVGLGIFLAAMFCACGEAHVHVYSDVWQYDETYHWQVPICGDTDEIANKDVHNFVQGVCHLCHYSPNSIAEAEFYNVTYAVDGVGGKIEGENKQRIKNGGDATPVRAIPDEGYLFVMWSDGEINPERQDGNVKENLNLLAVFQPDPDNPDIDDDENFGNDHIEDEDADNEKNGESDEENGLIFTEIKTLTDDTVTGYSVRTGSLSTSDVSIPKEHKEKPVTKIEDNAFMGSGIASISIPASVTKIGHQAFMNCVSLREIEIPDSVLDVGNQAFQGCSSLSKVKLSGQMKGVWYKMFFNCSSLTEIEFPDSIESLGRYAFYNCTSLTKLKFGRGIQKCGAKAFQNCTNLTEVHIVDIKAWCETTFDFFMLALSSTFESNPLFYAQNLYYEDTLLEDLEIPEGTKMINSYAFINCRSLKHVKIPGSVKIIGKMVFQDCQELETVEFSEGLISMQYSVFGRCYKLKEVAFPDSLETMGSDPDAIEKLISNVFYSCKELEKVTLGKGLRNFEFCLCSSCPKLADIYYNGTESQWRALDLGKSWLNDCAELVTVHCVGSGTEIRYRQEWVVQNYTRFPCYFEQKQA